MGDRGAAGIGISGEAAVSASHATEERIRVGLFEHIYNNVWVAGSPGLRKWVSSAAPQIVATVAFPAPATLPDAATLPIHPNPAPATLLGAVSTIPVPNPRHRTLL